MKNAYFVWGQLDAKQPFVVEVLEPGDLRMGVVTLRTGEQVRGVDIRAPISHNSQYVPQQRHDAWTYERIDGYGLSMYATNVFKRTAVSQWEELRNMLVEKPSRIGKTVLHINTRMKAYG